MVFKNNIFDDSFVWNQPGSAIALGILGGLTVIGWPIALPIAVDIENEELKNQVTASNERISAKVAESILEVTSADGLKKQLQNVPSTRLKAVKEMFENGLISAEDYEIKRKEILNGI